MNTARMNDVTIGFDSEAVELINRFVEAAATVKSYGDITITDIQRIVVQPGEALVVRIPGNTSLADRDRVVAAFKDALPGMPVLVINADTIGLQVIAQETTA